MTVSFAAASGGSKNWIQMGAHQLCLLKACSHEAYANAKAKTNNRKRYKNKIQTSKKLFAFGRREQTLRAANAAAGPKGSRAAWPPTVSVLQNKANITEEGTCTDFLVLLLFFVGFFSSSPFSLNFVLNRFVAVFLWEMYWARNM